MQILRSQLEDYTSCGHPSTINFITPTEMVAIKKKVTQEAHSWEEKKKAVRLKALRARGLDTEIDGRLLQPKSWAVKKSELAADLNYQEELKGILNSQKMYFKSLHVVTSWAKASVEKLGPVFNADACHGSELGSDYGLYMVVGYDSGNHIVPLQFSIMAGNESHANWAEVLAFTKEHLPHLDNAANTMIADFDKGLYSAMNEVMPRMARLICSWHRRLNFQNAGAVGLWYERLKAAKTDAQYGMEEFKMREALSEHPEKQAKLTSNAHMMYPVKFHQR